MSLSPWLQPSAINSPLQAAASFDMGGYNQSGTLDKRNLNNNVSGYSMGTGGLLSRTKINEYTTVAETITNALGTRSPYFKIGEIPADNWWNRNRVSDYLGKFGNVTRAVSELIDGPVQEGVIIDCLGEMAGNIAIDITTNPILFKGNQVADGRLRTPNTLKVVVAVSNYNNDDIIGMAVDTLAALDTTGILQSSANMLQGNGNTRAQIALYKLRGLQEQGQPFKVYTPHGIYENMVIKAIEPITNEGTMDMLFASITFVEIIYAQPYYSNAKDAAAVPVRENIIDTKKATDAEDLLDAVADAGEWVGNKVSSVAKKAWAWIS